MTTAISAVEATAQQTDRKLVPVKVAEVFNLPAAGDLVTVGYNKVSDLGLCPVHLLNPNYQFQPKVLGWLLRCIMFRKSLGLVGQYSTGKSSHVIQAFIRLNMDFTLVKGSSDIEPSSLYGRFGPKADGTLGWLDGPVTKAARLGIPCLIEERDAMLGDASTSLNSVMDGMPIHLEETGEVVVPKKGFVIFTTGNTVGAGDESGIHSTSKIQPAAATSRQVFVEVDYMKPEDEKAMLANIKPQLDADIEAALPGINDSKSTVDPVMLDIVVRYASGIRDAVKRGEMSRPFGTRELEDFTMFFNEVPLRDEDANNAKAVKGKLHELLEVCYWNKLSSLERAIAVETLNQLQDFEKA